MTTPKTQLPGLEKKRDSSRNLLSDASPPTDTDDLVNADRAGAAISQIAVDLGISRTTVTCHLDRHQFPRHQRSIWDDDAPGTDDRTPSDAATIRYLARDMSRTDHGQDVLDDEFDSGVTSEPSLTVGSGA